MTLYGKIENGNITSIPKPLPGILVIGGKTILNPGHLSSERLAEYNFYPASADVLEYNPEIHTVSFGDWYFEDGEFRRDISLENIPIEDIRNRKKKEIKEKAEEEVRKLFPMQEMRDYVVMIARVLSLVRLGIDESVMTTDQIEELNGYEQILNAIIPIEEKSKQLQSVIDSSNDAETIAKIKWKDKK
ncbi:MAG: hypothetical protein GY749_18310 [Desulfobacteraceae bacterium]|nr:hypothetical protein [Desulfobacteraceae bacterium]